MYTPIKKIFTTEPLTISKTLKEEMAKFGFVPYLKLEVQGDIFLSFLFSDGNSFDFNEFNSCLNEHDLIIYTGN